MSLFVTIEGIEGSGKSTLVRALAEALRTAGHRVLATHEPGGTTLGRALRAVLLGSADEPPTPVAELLLYLADRREHIERVIRPALAAGTIVLCDRFSDSTLAYQGHGRGLDLDLVRRLDGAARDGLTPDLTIVLDCPPDAGIARAHGRGAPVDRFEAEPLAFHQRVRDGFLALARSAPARYVVVDSTAPAERVRTQALAAVTAKMTSR